MPGMHGNYTAVTAMQKADLLIALGSRFDDRVTGKVSAFAPGAKVVHVDIDKAEIGKVRRPEVGILADCRLAIEALVGRSSAVADRSIRAGSRSWIATLRRWQAEYPCTYDRSEPEQRRGGDWQEQAGATLKPQFVIETLRASTPRTRSSSRAWASIRCGPLSTGPSSYPNTWINSGGLGTMGFAVPAAIGAKVGRPDRMVWAVDGDGCFQMTAQELATATRRAHPGEDRDLEQRLPRAWSDSGSTCSTRSATPRSTSRRTCPTTSDGPRRWAASACAWRARGGHARHREGQRHRRPARGDRLPHRLDGKGLPDGARRGLQRRHRRAPVPATPGLGACRNEPAITGPTARATACSRSWSRTRPACSHAWRGLFSRRGYNIFSLAVAPTDDERFSRITIVVDVESAPLEQVVAQLDKLINVVEIGELHPDEAARPSCCS